jgi:putative FmdB family regulatory protein
MPIYGYICKSCEHTLDALQKISDDPLVYCPDCGEPQLKRQLSAPRFRLKGKGWYETDFKTDNRRNLHGEKETTKKDDKPASGSGDKKSDKASAKKEPSSATKTDAG